MQHEWPAFQSGSWRCRRCGCLSGSIDAKLPCKPVGTIYADDPAAVNERPCDVEVGDG